MIEQKFYAFMQQENKASLDTPPDAAFDPSSSLKSPVMLTYEQNNNSFNRRKTDAPVSPKLDPRKILHKKRLATACLLMLLYLFVLAIPYSQQLIDGRTIFIAATLFAAIAAIFYFLFTQNLFWKEIDPNLTTELALCAFITMLFVMYRAPATYTFYGPFILLGLILSAFRLPQISLAIQAFFALLGYGAVIALHYRSFHLSQLTQAELMNWGVLALITPIFVVLGGRIRQLHQALFKAGIKIENIEEHARRDELTGCYNRRYMSAVLQQQKHLADVTGEYFCLAVMDLDHFKRINDEIGHLAGDDVLRGFSRMVQQSVRDKDVFGRYGGEEFLLMLPKTKLLDALNTAERIRGRIESYPWQDQLRGRVTVSIGVTQYVPGEAVHDLFARADMAMYLAKTGGRNQVIVEEAPSMHQELKET